MTLEQKNEILQKSNEQLKAENDRLTKSKEILESTIRQYRELYEQTKSLKKELDTNYRKLLLEMLELKTSLSHAIEERDNAENINMALMKQTPHPLGSGEEND